MIPTIEKEGYAWGVDDKYTTMTEVMDDTLIIACELYGVTIDEVKSRTRARESVDARIAFTYHCIEGDIISASLKMISRYLKRECHSSVIHYREQYSYAIEAKNPDNRQKYLIYVINKITEKICTKKKN